MNSNELEKHLLTRCYDSQNRIVELLEQRYATNGDQKSSIVFTKSESTTTAKLFSNDTPTISRARLQTTRKSLKAYISSTLANQRKLNKRIKQYKRKSHTTSPFPRDKLIEEHRIPQITQFIHMNKLWQKYMQDLLFPNGQIQALPNILPKLSSADFNGCLVKVVQSRNRNCVGMQGIVVWDAQHSFVVCVPGTDEDIGGFKVIPKQHTLFAFDLILPSKEEQEEEECIPFTIIGSRFEVRSVDRSGKKFKNHSIDDIL
ncbi:uncharacterized protein SPAPADRAFT_157605 [Spathaspora passalidarum NRRL Y-27907]|uniref:Ribonuclease P protein subunit n=1 Tax=Spathaspora passalidarum (strain NRRL Y-27907 / 11-Y1) TaxID=619300 RepID=G3AUC3_SPAPN|nr:uncharacterized protein SPAPADRAFT_157605 [Spathaspora passalidarum NRRL Y-27907]EGW30499.1 hypothetical protein SPAPADRAFT_157605 [Spathaspora passalidarum NRRL Y-27907]